MSRSINNRLFTLLFFAVSLLTFPACSSSRKIAGGEKNPGRAVLSEQALRKKYAARIAATPGAIDNLPLYRFIDEWYGTPYAYGGNGKRGIDCSAFSSRLYMAVYDTAIPRTAQLQYDASRKVKKRKLKEGDLVFFNEGGRKITHVGIYLANHYFVHASTGGGVMISNLDDAYWEDHFVKGGKLR